jgi:predicted nucleic acid-binding protein
MTALDTNVLVYACDKSDARRQHVALDLIASATDGLLLWQVACEFIAASRKLSPQGFTAAEAWSRLEDFLGVFRLTLPSADVLGRAQDLHLKHSVSFWDAMIVAACLDIGVDKLYSEDIPAQTSFGELIVINPFG